MSSARSVIIRKLVVGLGTTLIVTISILTRGTLPLSGLSKIIVGVVGAAILYISISLALAIHRSYPAKHDKPEDIGQLFTEGPYSQCRHPFYLLVMLAQISTPLTLTSLTGLLVAIALIPAWLVLIKIEEEELIKYWGEKYLNYMRTVPALMPDLRKMILKAKRKHDKSDSS